MHPPSSRAPPRPRAAQAAEPHGPFVPDAEPLAGSSSIDPAAFVDEDGQVLLSF